MADLGGEFDTTIHVSNKFENLPEGEYELMVTKSEMKPTSKGTGKILSCTFTVLSGPQAKRIMMTSYNWENPNPIAVQIGKGEFSDLCKAVGVPKPRDSQQIHNIPFIGKVTVEGEYNKIKSYKPRAIAGAVAPAAAAAPPPVATGAAPWSAKT
jgi:hypothetical protein